MRPHMKHICDWQLRKFASIEAGRMETSYAKYKLKVDNARKLGFSDREIVKELNQEAELIRNARHEGDDPFFKTGVENAKHSCLNALNLIISELEQQYKGEN